MLEYLSLAIMCFIKLRVSLKLRSQKTVCLLEQIMCVDKYPSIFLPQMECKYARIFVLKHYLFFEAHSLCSRKTALFSEQIMSTDKYPCMFSCQMAAIAYSCFEKVCLTNRGKLIQQFRKLWLMVVFMVAWVNLMVFQCCGRKQHKRVFVLSRSLSLNHLESQSSKAKLLLPIMPISIVMYALTLSGDNLVETAAYNWHVTHF